MVVVLWPAGSPGAPASGRTHQGERRHQAALQISAEAGAAPRPAVSRSSSCPRCSAEGEKQEEEEEREVQVWRVSRHADKGVLSHWTTNSAAPSSWVKVEDVGGTGICVGSCDRRQDKDWLWSRDRLELLLCIQETPAKPEPLSENTLCLPNWSFS